MHNWDNDESNYRPSFVEINGCDAHAHKCNNSSVDCMSNLGRDVEPHPTVDVPFRYVNPLKVTFSFLTDGVPAWKSK